MREDALSVARLDSPDLKVCDVGGGTGFCTQGIVKAGVRPENITLLDQSPHQLAKARGKADLAGVETVVGDAEDLPFETDAYDRYVSAGSIEYWPEPQRGICEAYRVIKPGEGLGQRVPLRWAGVGVPKSSQCRCDWLRGRHPPAHLRLALLCAGGTACLIGPVHPTHPVSRFFADVWMLFPTEEEYIEWFTKAGFENVHVHRIGPKWYRGVRRHGLIMGCSVVGTKPKARGDARMHMRTHMLTHAHMHERTHACTHTHTPAPSALGKHNRSFLLPRVARSPALRP